MAAVILRCCWMAMQGLTLRLFSVTRPKLSTSYAVPCRRAMGSSSPRVLVCS
jgi:hypothetical protein